MLQQQNKKRQKKVRRKVIDNREQISSHIFNVSLFNHRRFGESLLNVTRCVGLIDLGREFGEWAREEYLLNPKEGDVIP